MTPDVASELARQVPELDVDWQSAQDSLDLPTVALGLLASRLVELDGADPALDWSPLFADVERRLESADSYTREILVTGFLEGLQNVTLNAERDPARWTALLGPVTSAAWSALNDLWSGELTPKRWNEFMARDIGQR